MQHRIDGIYYLLHAIGIQEQCSHRKNQRQPQRPPAMRIPARRKQRTCPELKERAEEIDSRHKKSEEERSVKVDPKRKQDRQPEKPTRIDRKSTRLNSSHLG